MAGWRLKPALFQRKELLQSPQNQEQTAAPGTEMMNIGAPITGIDSRPLNKAGIDIRKYPSGCRRTRGLYPDKHGSRDDRHHTNNAIRSGRTLAAHH